MSTSAAVELPPVIASPARATGAAFLSPSARTERCRALAEAGHLLARVVAVGRDDADDRNRASAFELAPGTLGRAIHGAVEISLALRGALPPAVGLNVDLHQAALDQLFRVRTLGSPGLVVVLPSLTSLARGGALGVDDSESVRVWHELARREAVSLLFDATDASLSVLAPRPLGEVLEDVLVAGENAAREETHEDTPAPVSAEVAIEPPTTQEPPTLAQPEVAPATTPMTWPFDTTNRSTAEHLSFDVRGHDADALPATRGWDDGAWIAEPKAASTTEDAASTTEQLTVNVSALERDHEADDDEVVAERPSVELGATLRAALDALPAITEASSPGLLAVDDEIAEDDDDWSSSDAFIEAELGPPPISEPSAPLPEVESAPEARPTSPRVIRVDPLEGMDDDDEPMASFVDDDPAPWLSLEDRERFARELAAAAGPRPVKAIEDLYRTRWMPLFEALCLGLDDPEVARAVDDWSAAFEHSYHEGFNTMRLTGKRPTMVLDAPDVAARIGRLNGARAVQLLLVDGMRYDLGLRVREALADRLRGLAACVDENLLWSALPTVTPVQMRLLSTGPRGLREGPPPSDRDPVIHREGSVATLRRVRIGQRDVIKLDLVEARLRDAGPGFEPRMHALAEEVADVIASFVDSLPPRTLLYLFGDHGFHLPLRGPRATGPAEQGGASPEEVLVGGQAWLVDDVH